MRLRGFFLTIDSLLALAILLLALGTLTLGAQQTGGTKNTLALEALARDYLFIKYVQNVSFTPALFASLTGLSVSETPPGASVNLSIASRAYAYPFPLAGCGCPSTTCTLDESVNASCLNGQESLTSVVKRAWVTP